MKYEKLLPRFLDYVKVNTRSDENSTTVPSVPALVDFAHKMADEMREIGIQDVHYLESNGYVVGTIPATTDKNVPEDILKYVEEQAELVKSGEIKVPQNEKEYKEIVEK